MEKIWLKNYPAGIPDTINPDSMPSIGAVFNKTVSEYPKNPAVSNMGTVLSYEELDRRATCFAAYLQQKLGVKKGACLAIMMPNLIQYLVAIYGAFKAGMTITNVNPLYTPRELVRQLNDSKAEAIVVLSNFASTVEKALPKLNLKHIFVTDIGDSFPRAKAALVNFIVKRVKKMVPAFELPSPINFLTALKEGSNLNLAPVQLEGGDAAFLQYTGGTTGVSKGAILTHRNMVANMEQAYAWMKPFIEHGKEKMVTALPLYHIFSLLANCFVFMKAASENILITNPRDIGGFIKELQRVKFTSMTGVNTLFNALTNHKNFAKVDFSHFKVVLGGGMAVRKAVADKWQEITGIPITEAYGLTETSPAVTINPLTIKKYTGSIGLPVPSTDIKIIDEEDNELPLGESGELCVKGPQVMKGYLDMPEETAMVLSEDGWLKTGDMARVDEEGYVYIVDRKKDMVDISGFNVYPNEVEEVLMQHPDVNEAAVIGVSHSITGEKLKAFVTTVDNKEISPKELIAFCRQHLTAYKVPKIFEFCEDLPKSNVGKILRRELRDEEAKKSSSE
jgi:long-chain acyl-CoA synthetase